MVESFITWISKPLMVVLACWVLFRLVKYVLLYFRGKRRFKIVTSKWINTREQIEADLDKFETEHGRFRYVRWINDIGIVPSGSWSKDKPPNYGNDRTSVLLAQLEGKWLGIER